MASRGAYTKQLLQYTELGFSAVKPYSNKPANRILLKQYFYPKSPYIVSDIKGLFGDAKTSVQTRSFVNNRFPITKGLKMGYSMSPLFFNIPVKRDPRGWKKKCKCMVI